MKTALGKGLSALIPDKEKTAGVHELDIDRIVPNEVQPRRLFRDSALQELVASIRENGIIQPVIVRKTANDLYQLIAGERRWRAAKMAGLTSLPSIIREATPANALQIALIENIQREDLNPIETAEAFQRLMNDFSLTHDTISKKVGKDRATVTNYLRILKLPSDIRKWIAENSLSIGHAKALLQIEDANLQIETARKIMRSGLSVREAEELSRKGHSSRSSGATARKQKDPQIASLEEKLMHSLGTKVKLIHKGKKGGKVEIDYYSLEELDRLLEILIQ